MILSFFVNLLTPCHTFFYTKVIDGNLHFNVLTPNNFEKDDDLKELLEPFIFEAVMRRKGSISAEHGLGQCKNEYLNSVKSTQVLSMMKMMKSTVDPKGILNPGKYLPTSSTTGSI